MKIFKMIHYIIMVFVMLFVIAFCVAACNELPKLCDDTAVPVFNC